MKNSFVLYTDYMTQLELLDMEQRGILITSLFLYQMGRDPLDMDGMSAMAFAFIKAQIDRDNEKYEQTVQKRREAGAKGGKQSQANQANASFAKQSQANQADNVNDNDNDIKEILPKGSTKKSTAFHPPTIEQVQAYVTEKGYKVDAQRFVDFYESKGWFVGKNKMKDWKAAVRNWGRNLDRTQRRGVTTKAKANFTQRDNDYALLQERLIER